MECTSLGKIALNAPLFAFKETRQGTRAVPYRPSQSSAKCRSAHVNYHNCASYNGMNNKWALSYCSSKSDFLFVHRDPATYCIGYSYTYKNCRHVRVWLSASSLLQSLRRFSTTCAKSTYQEAPLEIQSSKYSNMAR